MNYTQNYKEYCFELDKINIFLNSCMKYFDNLLSNPKLNIRQIRKIKKDISDTYNLINTNKKIKNKVCKNKSMLHYLPIPKIKKYKFDFKKYNNIITALNYYYL